jgi:phospholipid/cholesterol/gamma-HCH transport system substrate-binding protein
MSTQRIAPLQNDPREGTDRSAADEDPTLLLPARDTRRQIWAGLFVILGIVATLVALFSLTSPALFRGRYILNTLVPDAGGLRRGDPVQMRGVNIGRVQNFKIEQNGVRVRLEIEGEYTLPRDSHVELKSSGLLGGMNAVILPGRSQETLANGDEIPGGTAAGSAADVSTLTSKADSVLASVQKLLNDRNVNTLGHTVTTFDQSAVQLHGVLNSTSTMIAEQRNQLRALTASLNRSAAGLESATGPQLAQTTQHLNAVANQMDLTVQKLNASTTSLQTILSRVERGEGTLGKLSKDDQLYNNLVASVNSLKQLADDIKANPKKYINLRVF